MRSWRNLLQILVTLHAKEMQQASGWTGCNISLRNKIQVLQDVIRYLPTIDGQATDMVIIHEVLVQWLKIKNTLKLKGIVNFMKASEVQ